MESDLFEVLPLTQANDDRYGELAEAYWKWIYSGPNPDSDRKNPDDPKITFLRDDVIGGPIKHEVGISKTRGARKGEDPTPNEPVKVDADTHIFFPVYHVFSVTEHPYVRGGTCENIGNCREAARMDLDNCYLKWAQVDGKDIVDDLTHEIYTNEFDIKVGDNNLRREVGFYLNPRPDQPYHGIAVGTYLLLQKLKPGKFTLDFGGRATDFHSQRVYEVTVRGYMK